MGTLLSRPAVFPQNTNETVVEQKERLLNKLGGSKFKTGVSQPQGVLKSSENYP